MVATYLLGVSLWTEIHACYTAIGIYNFCNQAYVLSYNLFSTSVLYMLTELNPSMFFNARARNAELQSIPFMCPHIPLVLYLLGSLSWSCSQNSSQSPSFPLCSQKHFALLVLWLLPECSCIALSCMCVSLCFTEPLLRIVASATVSA